MKAAVMFQQGGLPQYVDFPEPSVRNAQEVMMFVKAAALKNIDRSRARGQHYSAQQDLINAAVIGGDGVGLLEDGMRVYAIGASGMIAEKATVYRSRMVSIPAGLDDAMAAALPNAVIGSAMALRFRTGLKPGETVLINGATGFTGKMAVQVARYYGAGKIVVTGRNAQSLQGLRALGAAETVSLMQDEDEIVRQLSKLNLETPFDVIIDYLWGRPAELMLSSLKGSGSYTHKTRFVSVGAVAGDSLQLSSEILRSVDLQLSGSGLGSWTDDQLKILFADILPDMFRLAATGQLRVDTASVALKDIEQLWSSAGQDGKRLVVMM